MRWSPINTVFSIEPLGITRAWATPPSMRTKASATQNHEIASRTIGFFLRGLRGKAPTSRFTMSLDFELNEFGGVAAGVAGGAKLPFSVADGLPQRSER